MKQIIFIFLLVLSTYISCKSKEEWKSRSIYQILTDRFARTSDKGMCNYGYYCGGNYQGIIQKLDYIKGMGFDVIWISPIVENKEDAYHGYHLTNLYNLNTHFGSEDDFKALISACHEKDIWVMVDVVANHVAPIGTDYSQITPFNSAEHYHDPCQINDWGNQWQVENCRLSDLPDLKQENEWVTEKLVEWIHDLVSKYDLDGIRIDTIMEVPKWFWDKFRASAGVFQIGEAFHGDIDYVSDYQNHLDSVFNYPLYYSIESGFCGDLTHIEGYWFNNRPKYPNQNIPLLSLKTTIIQDFYIDAMTEVNLQMLSFLLFYGKVYQFSTMEENNITQVEKIQITENHYGITIILIVFYIKFLEKFMLLEKKLVFGIYL